MKHPKHLLLLTSAILLLINTACQKDYNGIDMSIPKIKKEIQVSSSPQVKSDIILYEYNSNGLISKETHSEHVGYECDYLYEWNYTYSDNKIILSTEVKDGCSITKEYALDDNGMAISLSGEWTAQYDSEGFLVSKQIGNKTIFYEYQNSDLYKTIDGNYEYKYFYYTPSNNTIGNANRGKPFLGKQSKFLMSHTERNNMPDEGFWYDFYDNGNVETMHTWPIETTFEYD